MQQDAEIQNCELLLNATILVTAASYCIVCCCFILFLFVVVMCNIGFWLLRCEVLSSTSPAHTGEAKIAALVR
jgi:hypothetical protein